MTNIYFVTNFITKALLCDKIIISLLKVNFLVMKLFVTMSIDQYIDDRLHFLWWNVPSRPTKSFVDEIMSSLVTNDRSDGIVTNQSIDQKRIDTWCTLIAMSKCHIIVNRTTNGMLARVLNSWSIKVYLMMLFYWQIL